MHGREDTHNVGITEKGTGRRAFWSLCSTVRSRQQRPGLFMSGVLSTGSWDIPDYGVGMWLARTKWAFTYFFHAPLFLFPFQCRAFSTPN